MEKASIDLSSYADQIKNMSPDEQRELLKLFDELQTVKNKELAQTDFIEFVKQVWPAFIAGRHHRIMADAFQRVANGELKRLIINMPPRHTKSEFASYLFPAWFLGQYPAKKVIQTAHTAELAVNFGRKVRNLVDNPDYKNVFSELSLSADSKAAGRWATSEGGDYFAIGVGGAVTGKGADVLIIDDPHSEQDAAIGAYNPEVYDKVYEWYTSGPRQRLQPGGAIIIVMCMTGDTPVLMGDGTEKNLSEIRPGDVVATFDHGTLTKAKVNNWQSSGVDSIYKIKTQSGRIVRANERHPFLVLNEGVLEWTRLNQLMVGDELVSLKDATDLLAPKQSPENAPRANPKNPITEKTLTHQKDLSDTMASGKASGVNAENQSAQKGCAFFATENNTALKNQHQSKTGQDVLSIDTASLLSSMRRWSQSVITVVMSVASRLLKKTHAHIGVESCVSTTVTTQEKFEGCCATTATLQWDMERRQRFSNELRRISDFTTDPIVSITPDGEEEVFDVEIDQTENFIANGLVSHNTRWSVRDLTGQILKKSAEREGSDEWEVIEFPAIMPSGEPLWPEFWPLPQLEALKAELPVSKWQAQYQQDPTSEEGALIKREWWRTWDSPNPPPCEAVIQSWDTAFLKTQRSDYSACTTWGVFYHPNDEGKEVPNLILLDSFKGKYEFPELKKIAHQHYWEWEPDQMIVEAKASGAPLVFELRAMGIPVTEFTPSRGQDKIARVNAITDLFASGVVWTPPTRWADELIEECAAFPTGDHDDLVDSMSQALLRFRQGGWIRSTMDDWDDEPTYKRKVEYY